jgi:hypothetical protein
LPVYTLIQALGEQPPGGQVSFLRDSGAVDTLAIGLAYNLSVAEAQRLSRYVEILPGGIATIPTAAAKLSQRVSDLLDVSRQTPSEGQTLVWRSAEGAYLPETVSGGGGGGGGVPNDGSVTNVKVAANAGIVESKLSLASDAAAGTPSRRSLGTGAQQAVSGTDSRLSDSRTPIDGSVTNAKVATSAAIAKSKLASLDIVNADVNASAAIAQSKIANLSTTLSAKADLVAGLVPIAQLASGTPDGTKFVRDDGVLATPSGGGTSVVDATTSAKGIVLMSVAPAVAASPTAVSTNDIRVTADQSAGTASIRTIGTGALQAAAGNHTHAAAKGFVNHGAVASTSRPSGYSSVEWMGSVQPANAIDGDTWLNTA